MSRFSKLPIEVVFLCDPVSQEYTINYLSPSGDRPHSSSLELIQKGLKEAVEQVVHYADIKKFINNIKKHKKSVIFPYWFGELSRNRHALVPAICESYGLVYIGADAYTKEVCNDKHLAKVICRECCISTPKGFLLTRLEDLDCLDRWNYPAVVKPVYQGSSLGISEQSLVHDAATARAVALSLVDAFGWPVLVEEMLMGREISICMMGSHTGKVDIKAISWMINGHPDFLDKRLFTYDLKCLDSAQFSPVNEEHCLTPEIRYSCEKLFHMLDKVEVIRIDGRMTPKGFYAFELSPDLDLRPDGELAVAFGGDGYPALLKRLVRNALECHGCQAPLYDKD